MPTGLGTNLGAIQADRAKARELVLTGDLENLHKGFEELLAEPATKRGERVMIRMLITGDESKCQRVIRRPLDLATRMHTCGVTVDQHRQKHGWVV